MNEDLLKVLSDQLDCKSSNSKIINLEPLTGGASKEIWKFEIQSELERGKYILRRGSGIEGPLAIKTSEEAAIQKNVRKWVLWYLKSFLYLQKTNLWEMAML